MEKAKDVYDLRAGNSFSPQKGKRKEIKRKIYMKTIHPRYSYGVKEKVCNICQLPWNKESIYNYILRFITKWLL